MKPDQNTRVHFDNEPVGHRLKQAGREFVPAERLSFALKCGATAEGNVTIWRGPSPSPWPDCGACTPGPD